MSFIGEAVLSASVELLIEKLASQGLELFTRHEKLKVDFIEWKRMLEMIQAVLADAEDRQTKDKAVKKWLDNLQNLAYDAEDVLDELETEALRRELLLQEPAAAYQPSTSTSKFRKFIPTCCTNFSPRSIQFESKMVSEIEDVTARLQNAPRFVMHDLINDLAGWAAGEQYFRMEDTLVGENRQKFSQSLRHFSYICGQYDGDTRLEFICDVQHLRTFLPVNLSDYGGNYLAWSVLQMLSNLPRLRVFSLCGYRNIFNLPNEIGNLKHLRCLNLSRTSIQILPESINSLYNLHTILLEDCRQLKKLCNDMGNLKKLRHLKNSKVPSLEEMPKGFGKLTCLLTLGRFVVGKDSGSGLRELKSLAHLQGTLRISKLENVKDVGDACEAQLNNKVYLQAICLKWSARDVRNLDQCEFETQVLSMLKPHRDVQELTITGYSGTKFPIWLGDSSFSKLAGLEFEGCGKCTSLPSVGQLPFLKKLRIRGMDGVKSVGSEFYGNSRSVPFSSLEDLSFSIMTEWEEWIPCGAGTLPKRLLLLETLNITSCDQLLVTIQCLPALSELRIDGCKRVVFSSPHLVHAVNVREQAYFWRSETRLPQDIRSLNRLQISRCPQLLSLVTEEEHDQQQPELPCRLQFLELSKCEGLTRLPQALLTLSSLTEMRISGCASLVSFPQAALPSQLRSVVIEKCDALESLPEAWMHNSNSSLESLEIRSSEELRLGIRYLTALERPTHYASLEKFEDSELGCSAFPAENSYNRRMQVAGRGAGRPVTTPYLSMAAAQTPRFISGEFENRIGCSAFPAENSYNSRMPCFGILT
ncbi:hypothetical protein CUMW_275970 [Citrus unshiu]|uniref:Uncharacterized protein n=1 Tax=Citrus unshiu TaxID=55188 RepID=A0A2H5N1J6_CITUN|nr:hypothetical protein CUMW_275970 [Citrus unshiu]